MLHNRSVAVNQIQILLRESAVMKHPYPLLNREAASGIWLHKRFVSHEQSPHKLEGWNFNREIEWRNNSHWSKWESVSCAKLALMISRMSESLSQKSNLITAEILVECSSDSQLSFRLTSAFGRTPLQESDEVVEYLRIMEYLSCLSADFT
jgi:hypothetical protein